jgi:hypothetical protein
MRPASSLGRASPKIIIRDFGRKTIFLTRPRIFTISSLQFLAGNYSFLEPAHTEHCLLKRRQNPFRIASSRPSAMPSKNKSGQ